jgi:Flp pilus assembly protein CpaB
MELEYRDNSRRGRYIIIAGVVLALLAGGAAFFLINQAQQQASSGSQQKVAVVVAARSIPARKALEAADLVVRQVAAEAVAGGTFDDPTKLVGKVPVVTILDGQPITSNLIASSTEGGQFSILKPDETIAPDSPYWRAVAITVAPDLAVGGLVQPGMTVDVFLTATVNVPQQLLAQGRYTTDKTTKITYQDMEILARTGDFYIVRAPLNVAEEIEHLQATTAVTFSMALRPTEDTRIADASKLGETTNLIITRYGLPIPEVYPSLRGPFVPAGAGSAQPSPGPGTTAGPNPSPPPSASPSPSPSGGG